jgi:fatty acid kinase fatty acid binding subunit
MPIRVVTDSTCDLPAEVIARYGISVIPLYINIGERGYLDGVEITRAEFYNQLPTCKVQPTTAAPPPEKYRAVYETLAQQEATEILSIHISKTLSAVVDTARLAAQEIKSIPVTVFDSRQLSLGTGFLVETAARLAQAGQTLDEILLALNNQIKRSYVFAALDTLKYLRRSGRMNGVVTGLGSLLQIKPIMKMYDSKPDSERVRTRRRAMQRVIELLGEKGPLERVAIVHTHAPERVEELRRQAAHLLPGGEILSMDITPVIGVHIGPGAAGFAVVTKTKKEA